MTKQEMPITLFETGQSNSRSSSATVTRGQETRPVYENSERNSATRGEIEAAVCELVVRFEREYFGRGPKQIRAHLIGDLLLVRMSGVLTQAELQLVNGSNATSGCDLVKRMRSQLIETASPLIEKIVENVTGVNVLSTLFDIGFSTDEEFILFTLSDTPKFREAAKR